MTNTITRVFLDWDQPLLVTAVEWLARRYGSAGELNLGGAVVVVPGRRAGRRLLELLVLRAESDSRRLTPPRIETLGALPETLYPLQRPLANDLVQQLTWAKVLREIGNNTLEKIVPRPPAPDDALAWWSLGTLLWQQHRELAADGRDFGDVVLFGREVNGFGEGARWEALLRVQQQYLRTLDGLDLWDVQTARLEAIKRREPQTDRDLILLGTADMNQVTRGILDLVADRVTALIAAPEDSARWFDAHGCLQPAPWSDAPIDIPAEQIRLCDGPAEQAEQVTQELASFGSQYRADEVVIGLADEQLGPFVERQLTASGVTARWIEGHRLADSAPCRLLLAVAEVLERSRFEDFAAVVRHPDFGDWLARRSEQGIDLAALDDTFCVHLPISPDVLQTILEQPKSASTTFTGRRRRTAKRSSAVTLPFTTAAAEESNSGLQSAARLSAPVRDLLLAVRELLAPLRRAERKLNEWAEPLRAWLQTVYGDRSVDELLPEGRIIMAALKRLNEILGEIADIPSSVAPVVAAADAIRCVVKRTSADFVPPEVVADAVELLGWLELALDDTPAAIVTSFNEGFVPTSLNSDLFLPNELRRRLGLNDNTRRFARDAYAVSLLQNARRDVVWLVGRRDADGNPMIPSRLLFAIEPERLPERVLRFLEPSAKDGTSENECASANESLSLPRRGGEGVALDRLTSGADSPFGPLSLTLSPDAGERGPDKTKPDKTRKPDRTIALNAAALFEIPRPEQIAAKLGMSELLEPACELTLNVTEFRSYLACPYRYFLRHVLKLQTLDDDAVELDALSFGNVLHEVLRRFGQSEECDSADADKLRRWLRRLLSEVAQEQFGSQRRAAVKVQLKQLEARLDTFSRWQAKWRREGWLIAHAEVSLRPNVTADQQPSFRVDGLPVWLHGRIDRIDRNEISGEWAIFDYKSSDRGDSPEATHRKKKIEWLDLQLPLYRHLARAFALPREPRLGYINLPKDLAAIGTSFAEWSAEELSDADDTAMQVARRIARREFWPPTDPPPNSLQEFQEICQVGVFGRRMMTNDE